MAIDLSSLSGATQLTKNMWGNDNSSTWNTSFLTPQGEYTFISEDAINKGIKEGDNSLVSSWFLNPNNLAALKSAGEYVDLSNVKASGITSKDTWGNWVKDRLGQSPKGFLIPTGSVDFSSVGFMPANGSVKGIAKAPTGELVYATTGGHGSSYITSAGEVHDPYTEYKSLLGKWFGSLGEDVAGAIRGVGDIVQELGPIGTIIGNAVAPGVGTGLTIGTALGRGADPADVLKSVAISQGLGALTPTDTVDLNAATSGLQDVYGGNLPIEDITAAFDATGPLADTTITPDVIPTQTTFPPVLDVTPEQATQIEASNAAMQQTPTAIDEAGQLAPTTPAENPFLAGMEETTATEGAGVAGAENPTGTTVTTPEPVQEPVQQQASNLTPQQLYSLLKVGAGLFGGGGAIAAAAKGLMGGSTGSAGTGPTMPTIQAPTPFTGTYSGMNPYDAAYFQQVQQNYNRLFPTAPADVANPLQSWYQTQYKPDTTISNKLFGV